MSFSYYPAMEKEGLIVKIKRFFREVREETGKVNWPTRREAFKYALIVVLVSVVVATILGGFDYLLMEGLKKFVF
ncbi:MAG: preprotein translocase subunit SecE [Minisyncoccales bacterium]|jgi:preprotein translocase SecE subunit